MAACPPRTARRRRTRRANRCARERSLYADALAPFLAEVERLRPADAEVIDAHTHLGLDEDGRSLDAARSCSPSWTTPARGGRACSRCTTPSASPPTACPTTACSRGRQKATGGSCPSAAWIPPKTRSRRANAAWRPARAASSCTRARRTSTSTARRWTSVFALAEDGPGADPDPRRPRPAADRRGARRARAAPSRGRADPRPRRDLRPGDPHLAPGRASGRAVRHLLLLPARRDRAVRARSRRADRVRLRSALRPAGDHALHGAARGRARRPRRGSHAGRCSAGRWRRCSTATALPAGHRPAARTHDHAVRAPGARVRLRAASSAPRCSRASIEQAQAMLDMAIAACRDPEPGAVGEALETIGAALSAAERCCAAERGRACARRSTSSTARSCAPPPRSRRRLIAIDRYSAG